MAGIPLHAAKRLIMSSDWMLELHIEFDKLSQLIWGHEHRDTHRCLAARHGDLTTAARRGCKPF